MVSFWIMEAIIEDPYMLALSLEYDLSVSWNIFLVRAVRMVDGPKLGEMPEMALQVERSFVCTFDLESLGTCSFSKKLEIISSNFPNSSSLFPA